MLFFAVLFNTYYFIYFIFYFNHYQNISIDFIKSETKKE